MKNLIAYVPVINRQYLEWFRKHDPASIFVVPSAIAQSFVPRIERNLIDMSGFLSHSEVMKLLRSAKELAFPRSVVNTFLLDTFSDSPNKDDGCCVLPDEDLSHLLAEKILRPKGWVVEFESIWARWDMTAVKNRAEVIPDLVISCEDIDRGHIRIAREFAAKSPDWWRRVGAVAVNDGKIIAAAFNKHHPTEYETFVFGDPRINFDAGDPTGAEIYLSSHAEMGVIGACAREGVALKGASVYVTTFPCSNCARSLAECQIEALFFSEGYNNLKGLESLRVAGVKIVKVQ